MAQRVQPQVVCVREKDGVRVSLHGDLGRKTKPKLQVFLADAMTKAERKAELEKLNTLQKV